MRPETESYEITHERKFRIHQIPTRKNIEPKEFRQEKTQNTHEKLFWTHEFIYLFIYLFAFFKVDQTLHSINN